MSRIDAQAPLLRQANDPSAGFITDDDMLQVVDVIYDDMHPTAPPIPGIDAADPAPQWNTTRERWELYLGNPLDKETPFYVVSNGDIFFSTRDRQLAVWVEDGVGQGRWVINGSLGPMGPAGPRGPEGAKGEAGPQGQMGPQGPAGIDGPAGATGEPGKHGPEGPEGPQGPEGPEGAKGEQGIQGPVGATGPQGERGEQGVQGEVGPQGGQGDPGPRGGTYSRIRGVVSDWSDVTNENVTPVRIGDMWLAAASISGSLPNGIGTAPAENDAIICVNTIGLPGGWQFANLGQIQGAKGDTGSSGAQGVQGPKGDTGDRGPQGEKGDQGEQGPEGPRGVQGAQGPQGIQGPVGAEGAVGPIGQRGPAGPVGPAGPQGEAGPQGNKGDTGIQGPRGEKGDRGEMGAVGPTGPRGPQGPRGEVGDTGPEGKKGDPGDQGSEGPPGPQGIQGPAGPTGPQGAGVNLMGAVKSDSERPTSPNKGELWLWYPTNPSDKPIDAGWGMPGAESAAFQPGDGLFYGGTRWHRTPALAGTQGPQGSPGPQGSTGAQGLQGPMGPMGPGGPVGATGARGATGPQGLIGPAGPVGPAGPKGDTGDRGEVGAQGPKGDKGDTGLQGSHASFTSVEVVPTPYDTGNFNGSISIPDPQKPFEAKLTLNIPRGPEGPRGSVGPAGASVTGPAGPQGIQGAQGVQGPKGDKGDVGAQGPAGPVGPQGPQGPQGTQGPRGDVGPQGEQGNSLAVKGLITAYSATLSGAPGDMWIAGANFNIPTDVLVEGSRLVARGDGILIESNPKKWINIGPIQGAQGIQGPAGPQGAQGPAGPQGPVGPKGDTGQAITSPDADNAYVYRANGAYVPDLSRKTISVGSGLTGGGQIGGTLAPLQIKRGNGLDFDANGNLQVAFGSSSAQVARGDHTHADLASKADLTAAMPIGAIIAYAGASAPAGWHMCDGTAHGSAALQAVLGSTTTPDLRSRFIVGAGVGPGLTNYSLKAVGGAELVALTAAQSGMPDHAHGAWSGEVSSDHQHYVPGQGVGTHGANADHSHWIPANHHWSFTGGGHDHGVQLTDGSGSGDGSYVDSNPTRGTHRNIAGNTTGGGHEHAVDVGSQQTAGFSNSHAHHIDIPAQWTGGINANHSHGIGIAGSGAVSASQAHENRPPYYALSYIIRKG